MVLLQPTTLLLIFIAMRVLRSYQRPGSIIQRQQQHMRLVRVMWFVFVYSYFMLAFTSIHMLWCVSLDGRLVLAMDGAIQCFAGQHMPYAITAVVILCIIILPPPIILLIPQARQSMYLMGFIDEACSLYSLKRRWWASVNLLRRVLLSLLSTLWLGNQWPTSLLSTTFIITLITLHFFLM